MNWRRWLIDVPAKTTDGIWAAYGLWTLVMLFIAGPVMIAWLLVMIGLWFFFDIRIGW